MNRQKYRYRPWMLSLGGLLAAIPLVLSFAWSSKTTRAHASEREEAKQAADPVAVRVVKPTAGGMERTTTQPGTVRAFEYEHLYAKVSGYLVRQVVDIGSVVKKGQVLAEIDAPELLKDELHAVASLEQAKAQVRQMEAHLTAAKAELAAAKILIDQRQAEVKRAKANLGYREKQHARIKELADARAVDLKLLDEQFDQLESAQAWRDAALVGVQTAMADVESKQAKVLQADADLAAARANLNVADATLQKARVFVEFTRIRSHYDGVVTTRNYHEGDYIQAASHGDLPLLVVHRIDLMRVVVQVPDTDVPFCRPGDLAELMVSTLPQVKFPVYRVSRTSRSQDQKTRTMQIEVDVPNDKGLLQDGMYGLVTVHFKKFQQEGPKASCAAVCVPSSALRRESDKTVAYVVRNGCVHPVAVDVGNDDGSCIEVLSGLQPGDEVVNHPGPQLHDGVAVRVIPDSPVAPSPPAAAH